MIKNILINKGIQLATDGVNLRYKSDRQLTDGDLYVLKKYKLKIIDELLYDLTDTRKREIQVWLSSIGETDADIITEVFDRCRSDKETIKYFLQQANDSLHTKNDEEKCAVA